MLKTFFPIFVIIQNNAKSLYLDPHKYWVVVYTINIQ